MNFLFNPFIQCFIEMSKIFFNYSVPVFEVPLYVFLVLPLIFKILLVPISGSGSRVQSLADSGAVYLKSRVEKGKKSVQEHRASKNKEKGKFRGGSDKPNMGDK